jgi:hypothetical protein
MKGVSEKLKCIQNRYTIRRVFKAKDAHKILLLKARLERDQQQMAWLISNIPYDCRRSYIGETGKHLVIWLLDDRDNVKGGLVRKSK